MRSFAFPLFGVLLGNLLFRGFQAGSVDWTIVMDSVGTAVITVLLMAGITRLTRRKSA